MLELGVNIEGAVSLRAKVIKRKLKPEDVEMIKVSPQGYDYPPFQPVPKEAFKKEGGRRIIQ